jgi:hypothetical protein
MRRMFVDTVVKRCMDFLTRQPYMYYNAKRRAKSVCGFESFVVLQASAGEVLAHILLRGYVPLSLAFRNKHSLLAVASIDARSSH